MKGFDLRLLRADRAISQKPMSMEVNKSSIKVINSANTWQYNNTIITHCPVGSGLLKDPQTQKPDLKIITN